jgi:hypothetical protein
MGICTNRAVRDASKCAGLSSRSRGALVHVASLTRTFAPPRPLDGAIWCRESTHASLSRPPPFFRRVHGPIVAPTSSDDSSDERKKTEVVS